jgi:hypothetical protein
MTDASPEPSSPDASAPSATSATSTRVPAVNPYLHFIAIAVIGAVSVLAWLMVFELRNRLLTENEFALANPWLLPAFCLPFSLAAGLLVKYRHAPTNLDESLVESRAGDVTKIDWPGLPVNVIQPVVLAVMARRQAARGGATRGPVPTPEA